MLNAYTAANVDSQGIFTIGDEKVCFGPFTLPLYMYWREMLTCGE